MIGTVRFTLREDKKMKDGKCPMQMIYSIAGRRTAYNTKLSSVESNWDQSKQCFLLMPKELTKQYNKSLILTKVEIDEFNSELALLRSKITDIEKYYHGKEISSKIIIERLKEYTMPKVVKSEPNNLIYDYIDRYIEENQLVRVSGSLKVYGALKNHLKGFENHRGQRVSFNEINYAFFQSFQSYLFQVKRQVGEELRPLFNSTIAKQITTLKTFLSYARRNGIFVDRSYEDFRVKRDQKDVIALTQDEFDTLYGYDFSDNLKFDRVRDIFCLSASTGLRWSDIEGLEWHHIRGHEISITVHKTRDRLTIPLNTISAAILNKYKELDALKPLPMISGQNFNKYIKDVCKFLEFDTPIEIVRNRGAERIAEIFHKYELISAHTGRKTFVTLSLAKGISAEYIMKTTGHKDYKSFKRYIDIDEKSKAEKIVGAWGKPNTNFSLKVV